MGAGAGAGAGADMGTDVGADVGTGSGTTGTCKKTVVAAKVSGYSDVLQGSEFGLKSSIAQEPTSVAIEADKSVFQLCKSGVASTPCSPAAW